MLVSKQREIDDHAMNNLYKLREFNLITFAGTVRRTRQRCDDENGKIYSASFPCKFLIPKRKPCVC